MEHSPYVINTLQGRLMELKAIYDNHVVSFELAALNGSLCQVGAIS